MAERRVLGADEADRRATPRVDQGVASGADQAAGLVSCRKPATPHRGRDRGCAAFETSLLRIEVGS